MKQITPEIKQRIFALYWEQEIVNHEDWVPHDWIKKEAPRKVMEVLNTHWIEVKPLSSITDEDAIGVADIMNTSYHRKSDKISLVKTAINQFENDERGMNVDVADYLRSKGYALPYLDWSVDELVEAGAFKLKEN